MLLGRSEPVGRIVELLDLAREGESGVLAVIGDAGVGKSALIDHAAGLADGFQLVRTSGFESETELAFAGLGDLLRPLASHLPALPDVQRSALASALALGPPVGGDPVTVCVAALNLLAAAADDRPVLAVVDDAHWLDRASADVLAFVGRHLQDEGVVLVLAARAGTDTFDRRGLEVVELGGLEPDAAAELAVRWSGVEPAVAARLATLTGGNPLALRELAGALRDEQRSGAEPLPEPAPASGWAQHVF